MDISQLLATRWPIQRAVGLWVPDFYGNPVRFPFWGLRNFAEVTAYFGALALPLALASLMWARSAEGRFFGIVFLLFILVAWGTPLVWLVAWAPGFCYFRLVSLTAFIPFFGSAAAAFGLQGWLTQVARRGRVLWGTLLLVLAGLALITVAIAHTNRPDIAEQWPDILPHLGRTALIWIIGIALLLLVRWRTTLAVVLLLARIEAQDFNPWTTALLDSPLSATERDQLADAPLRSGSVAHITDYTPHRLDIKSPFTSSHFPFARE